MAQVAREDITSLTKRIEQLQHSVGEYHRISAQAETHATLIVGYLKQRLTKLTTRLKSVLENRTKVHFIYRNTILSICAGDSTEATTNGTIA